MLKKLIVNKWCTYKKGSRAAHRHSSTLQRYTKCALPFAYRSLVAPLRCQLSFSAAKIHYFFLLRNSEVIIRTIKRKKRILFFILLTFSSCNNYQYVAYEGCQKVSSLRGKMTYRQEAGRMEDNV